ncbi:hypothetical protein A2914_02840 [Candidatus Nomurabacteria bacterium RIFCSPLOWO2_01_FULL_41_21]|uniref:Uncharacterized protein n=2 Tax=Candidatus Nomuraibacteriota TaxID=1752729 RepID=A0A1F6X3W6_9BACT|nr:MAG: hypothetical protein A2647_02475 [Candidatus Nomurabacteria bacterium RIFCSPHIGHO2_01_FULL_40_24b]OGI88870.1 MAG: hypothetical protein A2914_02840 [Candidatus Nomurabacteria bacterium RIFCSPLOWO2_01_FULL_41_21]
MKIKYQIFDLSRISNSGKNETRKVYAVVQTEDGSYSKNFTISEESTPYFGSRGKWHQQEIKRELVEMELPQEIVVKFEMAYAEHLAYLAERELAQKDKEKEAKEHAEWLEHRKETPAINGKSYGELSFKVRGTLDTIDFGDFPDCELKHILIMLYLFAFDRDKEVAWNKYWHETWLSAPKGIYLAKVLDIKPARTTMDSLPEWLREDEDEDEEVKQKEEYLLVEKETKNSILFSIPPEFLDEFQDWDLKEDLILMISISEI